MVRVISATYVVCRGIRISFAFNDYLYLDLGIKNQDEYKEILTIRITYMSVELGLVL